ncbi:MAG: hypothetical protein ACPKOI_12345 [Pleomorphochaeta sp.]
MKKLLPIMFVALFFISCSTFVDITEAQTSYYQGDYDRAYNYLVLNSPQIMQNQGQIVGNLDQGVVSHAAKKFLVSNRNLSTAEKAIEANFTKSVTANIGSYLISESVRDYSSSFYEDIYTNIFQSLNYYHLNNIEDAMVEVRRSLEKLQLREQDLPKLRAALESQLADNNAKDIDNKLKAFDSSFYSSALSYYLSSLFSFEYGDYDTFRISRDKGEATYKLLNKYYEDDYYQAFNTLKDADKNSTLINFLAFTGLSPIKKTHIDRNVLVIDQYVDDNGIYHQPYYTNIVYSIPVVRGTTVSAIEVIINGRKYNLQPFENLGLIAYEALEQTCSSEYVRAYIRAVSREIAKATADAYTRKEGDTFVKSSMFSDIFTIFSYIAEGSGDLRVSHFFPSMSWIGSFEIAPGIYDIEVNYLNSNGYAIHKEKFKDYKISKGKANLLEVISAK